MTQPRLYVRVANLLGNPIWIFLLPLILGVLFLAHTSTHGDECMYRLMPRAILDEGGMPLLRFEWGHPGHFALVASLLAIQDSLGGGKDPLFLTQALNFLLHAWLAWTVFRVFRALSGEGRHGPAFLAGMAVASIPGWLWVSQMAMSDVSGNALSLLVAARLLLHELELSADEADPRVLSWKKCTAISLTGLLLSFSVLVRVSSLAYFPLFAWLALRLLLAIPQGHRLRGFFAFLIGTLIPQLAFYGYMAWQHGFWRFYDFYMAPVGDNSGFLADLPTLSARWWEHYLNGLGLVLLGLGLLGLGLGILLVIHRQGWNALRSRRPLTLGFVLLILPYLIAVARNQAWYEFRYQVPALFAIALGVGILGLVLSRWLPDRILVAAAILLVGANLLHAYPMLKTFRTREAFIESAVRTAVSLTPKKTAILSHYAHPFVDVLGEGRLAIPVHASPEDTDTHHTFLTFMLAEASMLAALEEGYEILYINEQAMESFRKWLAAQGWKEDVVYHRPFDAEHPDIRGLRNWDDFLLADMDARRARIPQPLQLLRPVRTIPKASPFEVRAALTDAGEMEIEVQTMKELKGRRCRILFGREVVEDYASLSLRCKVPFSWWDPLFRTSLSLTSSTTPSTDGLIAEVDGSGKAMLRIPKIYVDAVRQAWFTVVFHLPGIAFRESPLRTPVRRVASLLTQNQPAGGAGKDPKPVESPDTLPAKDGRKGK